MGGGIALRGSRAGCHCRGAGRRPLWPRRWLGQACLPGPPNPAGRQVIAYSGLISSSPTIAHSAAPASSQHQRDPRGPRWFEAGPGPSRSSGDGSRAPDTGRPTYWLLSGICWISASTLATLSSSAWSRSMRGVDLHGCVDAGAAQIPLVNHQPHSCGQPSWQHIGSCPHAEASPRKTPALGAEPPQSWLSRSPQPRRDYQRSAV